mmetsp:Transcript_4167/g.8203  ORF Transcript_4167/g.8203 Transcript_4167/m.8203 type:complete len:213 (-) Transcript_4167:291-929(-)
MSSSLCLTASSAYLSPSVLSTRPFSSSYTIALSRFPPFISPLFFAPSTADFSVNVRANAISSTYFAGVSFAMLYCWLPMGSLNEIEAEIEGNFLLSSYPNSTALCPSLLHTSPLPLTESRAQSTSSIPVSTKASTKGRALPSSTGTSPPSTSTKADVMPTPAKAEARCSTVDTVSSLLGKRSVVQRGEGTATIEVERQVEAPSSPTRSGGRR